MPVLGGDTDQHIGLRLIINEGIGVQERVKRIKLESSQDHPFASVLNHNLIELTNT